jgi:hypothetical protein
MCVHMHTRVLLINTVHVPHVHPTSAQVYYKKLHNNVM